MDRDPLEELASEYMERRRRGEDAALLRAEGAGAEPTLAGVTSGISILRDSTLGETPALR